MAKPRLYTPQKLAANAKATLVGDDLHYLKNVMRQGIGDMLLLFNETDGEFDSRILSASKKEIVAEQVTCKRSPSDERLPDTELIFPPIRHSRQDMLVEKATELGVKTLSPALMKNSAIKNINTARAYIIAKEAAEQSERLSVPQINPLVKLGDILARFDFKSRTLVYLDERRVSATKQLPGIKGPVSFLVGPEGGFAPEEFAALEKTPAVGVNLGRLVLRAETAAIAILTLHNLGGAK